MNEQISSKTLAQLQQRGVYPIEIAADLAGAHVDLYRQIELDRHCGRDIHRLIERDRHAGADWHARIDRYRDIDDA